jgi:protein-tyrosine-phosphatase
MTDRGARADQSIAFNRESSGENMSSQKVAFVCLHGSARLPRPQRELRRLARNQNLHAAGATKQPDGQINPDLRKSLSSPKIKNISLFQK